MAFLIEYASSGARSNAEEKCDKETQGDAEKRGACLAKARDQFTADVLQLDREASGKTTFKVYKRQGSTLNEVFVGAVELTEESPTTVRVRWTGRGRGQKPLLKMQKDSVLTVPNEYSLEIDDPEHGRLTYTAKIGLVGK
jgi:hypothetical protein